MKPETRREVGHIALVGFIILMAVSLAVSVSVISFLRYISFTEDQIRAAAPYTFFFVICITAFFIATYAVLRYFTVIRPLRTIQRTLDKITSGDFTPRISPEIPFGSYALLAQSIDRMTAELSGAEILKTDFISNVSHEMKTPIAVMKNYSRLLQSPDLTNAEQMEYAGAIAAASDRMSELITNILRLNRLENHQLQAKRERFDLSAQLAECVLQFENVWEEKDIEPVINLADDVEIVSDPELLGFIWNNLLSNAFKFTDEGGTVSLSLVSEGDFAAVSVSDTGCGMTAETGRHIFDKFYQGDTSHATQGNGLGLALVKRVIDIVGGEISVNSVLGEGSAFTVRLRRSADEQ